MGSPTGSRSRLVDEGSSDSTFIAATLGRFTATGLNWTRGALGSDGAAALSVTGGSASTGGATGAGVALTTVGASTCGVPARVTLPVPAWSIVFSSIVAPGAGDLALRGGETRLPPPTGLDRRVDTAIAIPTAATPAIE